MLEQEVKILNIDTEKVVTKLLQHHAIRTFSGFITDTNFLHPNKTLDFSVRVRKKNADRYVTFKKRLPTKLYKQALEIEVKIHDPARFLESLQEQGFVATRIKHKMRVSYQIQDTAFDIDCYEGIPPLLEIESPYTKLITFWIGQLELTKKPQLVCGVKGLMEYYSKKVTLPPVSDTQVK